MTICPTTSSFWKKPLSKLGFEVVSASNGEEALNLVADTDPDLVLLDLSMPVMGGLDVLRSLRADPNHGTLPVILLTAKTELNDLVTGLDSGADDYIRKPFRIEEVAARIKAHLRIQALQRQILENEKLLGKVEGIGQTLVTLAHHINNATQAISGMAQVCNARKDNLQQHHQLAEIAISQSARISAVLKSIQQMVDHVQVKTTDYAGDPDRMLDIEADLQQRLERLDRE